jgi:hypothetical protein
MRSQSRGFSVSVLVAALIALGTYGVAARATGSSPGWQAVPASVQAGANAAGQQAAAAAASALPGADPAIQRWFLGVDKVRAAFGDDLRKAEQAITAGTSAGCTALDQIVRRIVAALPSLRSVPSPAGARIATAVQPLMDTMGTVAAQCLAGSFAAAQSSLAIAIPQQASVQATMDAILDGDA